MRCPRCDADTPDGARFCIECGVPLRPCCPQGGAGGRQGWLYGTSTDQEGHQLARNTWDAPGKGPRLQCSLAIRPYDSG
jgi:hypothetical protein